MHDATLQAFSRGLAPGVRGPDVSAQLLDDGQQLGILGSLWVAGIAAGHEAQVDCARTVARL